MNDTIDKTEEVEVHEEVKPEEPEKKGSKKPLIITLIAAFGTLLMLFAVCLCLCFFTAPSLELKGEKTVSAEIFCDYKDEGALAKIFFVDLSEKVICNTSKVNTDILGEYKVYYTLNFFGREYKAERTVVVVDSTPPLIALKGDARGMIVSAMRFYTEPGFIASDNYDGALTDRVLVTRTEDTENGICTITYSVSDSFGNKREVARIVEIRDIIAPVITLNGDAEAYTGHAAYTDRGCTASDDLDGDLTAKVTLSTDYTPTTEGSFHFTYTVSDAAGNSAESTRYLYVKDTVAPVISINGATKVYLTVGQGAYTDAGATANDAFEGAVQVTSEGEVLPDAVGIYTITYTAADSKGNTAKAERTVYVTEAYHVIEGNIMGQGVVSDSTIYLTFDDGPSSSVTPRILDILSANGVKATFFIVNYSEENKALIARAIAEGHTIGIHGYSHDYGKIYSSTDAFIENITALRQRLIDDFGYYTDIIRFPGGSSNMVSAHYSYGIMTRLCPMMEELGYKYFDWNVSSGDAAGGYPAASTIANNVCSGLRHGRGNIVLMHDSGAKGTTADALQTMIDFGYANGYTFAGLSSTTPAVHHGINN